MSDTPDKLKDHRLEDILAYKQDFLTAEERAEVEAHLRGCESCQRTLEEVSRFLPALQQALTPKEISSEEMLARAMAQIRARPPKPAPFLTRIRLAMLTFAAAAASVVFLVIQPLLTPLSASPAGVGGARVSQPGVGIVAAPRRPSELQVDAGPRSRADAGPDAGTLDGGVTR